MQTGERQTARLRLKYLQSVLRKDMNFFDMEARDSNILFHISSDAILVQDAIGDKTGHAVRYLSQFFIGFAVGFKSVWQLTLLTLAVVPLMAVAGGTYTIIMSTLSEKGEAAYAEAGKVADEAISQIRTVYSFVGEEKAIEEYFQSLKKALKLGKKSGIAKGVGIGSTYGLLFCAWAMLLWYSSILVKRGDTNGAKAFTVIINVIFSGFALGQAAPNIAAISKGRAAAASILSMIETDSNRSTNLEDGIAMPKVSGQIEFRGVCFSYPSRNNMVFENLSFSISAGKTFAVVGPSGSGKSTVISMVQRFYEPASGKILLDGHDLKTLELKWLRQQMGLVSQEPALFAATITDNILFGKEDASMDQIYEAAKAANVHSFVIQLPEGYHTQVVESGNHSELISKGGEYASMASLQVSEHVTDASSKLSGTAGKSSFRELPSSQNEEVTKREMKSKDDDLSPANFSPNPSIWELVKLNAPEWPYAVLGSVGAMMAGMEAPLFALGITHMLTAFYSPDMSKMKKEVQLISLIFVGAAVVTVPIYILQHYFYTLMGERLITRVRLSMFSAILCNEIGWFDLDENSTGSLTSTLAADATLVRSTLADRLSTMVQNVSLTVTAFVIGFSFSWRVSAVVIACFPLMIGAAITEQLFLKGFGGDYHSYTRANAVAREAIANIRTVASFGAEERIAHQFASELNKPNKQVLLQGHISGIGYGASQFFSLCAFALGLWYASQKRSRSPQTF
ncbi:ATP-BINDING CASSETTE SUB-FAMILY B [Salix purpurea]|nr:ATP-BINDING CASSETTE SUB-FAMILY B [Salix purpurea]